MQQRLIRQIINTRRSDLHFHEKTNILKRSRRNVPWWVTSIATPHSLRIRLVNALMTVSMITEFLLETINTSFRSGPKSWERPWITNIKVILSSVSAECTFQQRLHLHCIYHHGKLSYFEHDLSANYFIEEDDMRKSNYLRKDNRRRKTS